jgi:NTP pyrophosphatase (non-canonical NTP hydrolase)
MTINELIQNVLQWGIDKGITGPNGKATILTQLSKTQEELTETRDAAVGLSIIPADDDEWALAHDVAKLDIKDGIGDCVVTLILAAELAGMTLEECLAHAYEEIRGRTGRMENGTFVKDKP